jgi:hypothetical protein
MRTDSAGAMILACGARVFAATVSITSLACVVAAVSL